MWNTDEEGFPVYITREVPCPIIRLQVDGVDAASCSEPQTRFMQGELGNCWLAAAIESLRQNNNEETFKSVVPVNGTDLEFRFWHVGTDLIVNLASDAVPTKEDGTPIFMKNVEGNEYWSMLLEKAYAKWVRSYEGLKGGFWADAIQSFTGGVVERIKIRDDDDNVNENLFDIMLTSYSKGSSLCCIKKVPDVTEKYHACCIKTVQIDEDNNKKIHVQDPHKEAFDVLTYDQFTEEYHRLDMCHTNLDNFSKLHGMNIVSTSWEKEMFRLQLEKGCGEFSINFTGTDDDQEACILIIELIQKIKPDEGEELQHVQPWDALVCLELTVNDEPYAFKVPQETHFFRREPGTHSVKVSTEQEEHREIYVRVFSKTKFSVIQNQ